MKNVEVLDYQYDDNLSVKGIIRDSRLVSRGDAFVAIRGYSVDGHDFVKNAVENGAILVIAEDEVNLPDAVARVRVKSTRKTWSRIACNRFGNPSDKLDLVGVTGTNGKTTTATLLYEMFTALDNKCGLISTNGNKIGDQTFPATHTTPDPMELNRLLKDMVKEGCRYAFMEVSSHALDQDRIEGLHFAGAIFTNLTHDHLDYHGDFMSYLKAKKKLFDQLSEESFALVNADDKNSSVMIQNCKAQKLTYGLKRDAGFRARIVENTIEGLHLEIDRFSAHFLLAGEYNASNLLAAYGCGRKLGVSSVELLTVLSRLKGPEGRFEKIHSSSDLPFVVIDYAHSPDALKKILQAMVKMKKNGQRLITVFGCGGDRDRTKRPEMGKIAAELSDEVIITSDNPRSENPAMIIEEVSVGIEEEDLTKVRKISSRKEAIQVACRIARRGDIVLIAGKGHEKYQEINGEKVPFDDKEIARKALESLTA